MSEATEPQDLTAWQDALDHTMSQLRALRAGVLRGEDVRLTPFDAEIGPLPPELEERARASLCEIHEVERALRVALDEGRQQLTVLQRAQRRTCHASFVDTRT